ncbi:MAG: M56 family metallopeptidase [Clostridia bacterium]|nr:M56 family metallopeptidase [Clostridia bacterium]
MNFMKTILELSVYSSIMILAVLALKAAFNGKIRHRIVIWMWMLVLLRLIIPITINSPLHFDSLLQKNTANETDGTDIFTGEAAETHATEENFHFEDTVPSAESDINGNNAANEALPENNPAKGSLLQKTIEFAESISLLMYVLVIWIAGAAISGLINLWSFISFNGLMKQCAPAEGVIDQAVQDIKARLKMKQRVKVIVCSYVGAPMTFRLLEPTIILPKSLTGRISEDKLNMILLHELCHIKRKDIFFNILWMFAKIVHWFNPLVWIGYNGYVEDIELSCDEMVNRYLDAEQSFIYSQSLIDVIRFSRNTGWLPAALSFCEDKSKLRKRVENMLKPQKKLKSAGGISLFLALIMIFTCFTTACQPTPQEDIVQNKNDGELEAAIMETAAPDETQDTDNKSVWIKDELSNDAGTIKIDIDARVEPISEEKITIARLEPYSFTEPEMAAMTEVFFGGEVTYYDYLTSTKADYENNIIYL